MSLPFLEPASVHRNVDLLALAVGTENPSRPRAYRDALNLLQGWVLGCEPGQALLFQGDSDAEEAIAHFMVGYDAPAEDLGAEEARAITAAVHESLDFLANLDSGAHATLDLLVTTLLIVRIPAFGGLSDALGIVMAGPRPEWPRLEIAELLWHEAVHQALFLQELVDPLFAVEGAALTRAGAQVTNPVLGAERPFDLAFHGAAVAVAVADLHVRARSRRAFEVLPEIRLALDEMTARQELLTARGRMLLDELTAAAEVLSAQCAALGASATEYEGMRPSRRSYLDLHPAWRE